MTRPYRPVTRSLRAQARDAALTGVQVFNNPSIEFRSESFIVLMTIAWTYLLHAHYRSKHVEYRYYEKKGKRRYYVRNDDGGFRYWELRKCLDAKECPLDNETKKNLQFLIGLRDEIVHHMSPEVDRYASARYQACCINFNEYIKKLCGPQYGLDQYLSFSLQFQKISRDQLNAPTEADLPDSVRAYFARFDDTLTEDELNSERFAFRILFTQKLVGKAGQADEVFEVVKADSELGKAINQQYMSFKEVERRKYRPKSIVTLMHSEGFPRFTMHSHTDLWQANDARNKGKGYGTWVEGNWFWYQSWVDFVLKHCQDNPTWYQ